MRSKILALEKIASQLEPSLTTRQHWTDVVTNYGNEFIEQIEEVPAYIETEDKGAGIYKVEIQEEGRPIEFLLSTFENEVDRPGLNPASGGHLAYIPGGGLFPAALGDYLASVTNRYAGIFFGSPGAVHLEHQLVKWMCRMIGYPDSALGHLSSGGSIANLTAIATARDAKLITADKIKKSVIYITEQVHHSIQKAIRIAGLNEAQIRYIPVDDRFRMNVSILKNTIEEDKVNGLIPFLLVASAGTTDTGAVDPLNDLADLAETHDLWFHVDGAYGGFFILCDEVAHLYKGIERSDSVTIDPHKGMFLPYGTGAVLMKDIEAVQNTHYYLANYMQDTVNSNEETSPADISPELTKHFRGARMWFSLQLFGVKAFRAALDEKIWLCRYFYSEIAKRGFETGPEPELSVCIYRYVPEYGDANEFNTELVSMVRKDGRVFLSSTTIKGVVWIRLAVLSFRSHLRTIDLALKVLDEKVPQLQTHYKKSTSTS